MKILAYYWNWSYFSCWLFVTSHVLGRSFCIIRSYY